MGQSNTLFTVLSASVTGCNELVSMSVGCLYQSEPQQWTVVKPVVGHFIGQHATTTSSTRMACVMSPVSLSQSQVTIQQ